MKPSASAEKGLKIVEDEDENEDDSMSVSHPPHRPSARGPGGFTLLEVMFAVIILSLCMGLTISGFVYTLRLAKAQHVILQASEDVMEFERLMKQNVVTAQGFIVNNGLQITQSNGKTGQLSTATNAQNSNALDIQWSPDTSQSGNQVALIKGVYALDASTPVFSTVTGSTAVRVQFRMGDHSTPTAADNAYTGVGYQAYVFDMIFTPRNSVN